MGKISLTIDGVQIEADGGQTVLQAAIQQGIYIPRLCYHPQLAPFGGCRLCIVEVQGTPGFPAACTTQVAEGMVVHTATDRVQELRKEVLQLLLARHPYTCLVCDRKGECDAWQGTIRKVGTTTSCQYCPQNGQCELQELVEYLKLEEIELPITYRGLPVEKGDPFFDRDYNLCIVCGRCVRVCQEVRHANVLAFTYRGEEALVGTAYGRPLLDSGCEFCGACVDVCPTGALADKIGKWQGAAESSAGTVCPYCSVGCALNLEVRGGQVIRAKPREEGQANRGQLCVRGRYAVVEVVHNLNRLTVPLVRNAEGRLVEATWEEALELVAGRLAGYKDGSFALVTSAGCTNEDNYVLQKFSREVMGSNNVDFASALPSQTSSALPVGDSLLSSVQDVARAACVVVVGSDVCNSHPVAGLQVRKALASGGRLVVIDPRRTKLAAQADVWLQPRPGSDPWLLAGMLGAVEAKAVEEATGVPPEQLRRAVELMEANKPPVFLFGSGLTHYPAAEESLKAIYSLAKLLGGKVLPLLGEGNLVGAYDMGARPDCLPGYRPVSDAPGLSYRQILQGIADGQVRALYLVGEMPPLSAGGFGREEMEHLEFLVVQDVMPGEVTELADVVLPAAAFAEVDGSFTNMEGRVQWLNKAVEPPGQARPDWWIACQLARKMGGAGFDFDQPAQVMAEIARLVPGYDGISYESLGDGGLLRVVGTPTGEGLLPLSLTGPRQITGDEYPFTLIVGRSLSHYRGASLTKEVRGMSRLKDERSLALNPQDAAGLGLEDGAAVVVVSGQGRLEATARLSAELPPGVAFTAQGVLWADGDHGGPKAYAVRIERG